MENNRKLIMTLTVLFLFFGVGSKLLIANLPAPTVDEFMAGGEVFSVDYQSDGSKIMGGDFNGFILRASPDNKVDQSFAADRVSGLFNGKVRVVRVLEDDSLLVGGDFTNFDQQIVGGLVKLKKDGDVDLEFSAKLGTGFDGAVYDIDIDVDKKIVIVGQFTSFNGKKTHGLIRLNVNGEVDETLTIKEGFNNTVRSILVNSKNEMHLAGDFTEFKGFSKRHYVKLNATGEVVW